MNRILTIFYSLLVFVMIGCDFDPSGLKMKIQVNTLAAAGSLTAEQHLRLAAWVQPDKPQIGDRPSRVFHKSENADLNLSNRNPNELCLPDPTDSTVYDCTTRLLVAPRTQIWVGGFFEFIGREDNVPDEGELLTVTGPITVPDTNASINNVVLNVVDPNAPIIPEIAEILNDFEQAIIDNSPELFNSLIHPFFASNWKLDFDQLAVWVTGNFSESGVTYANPLSAPLAGLLSDSIRTELDLKGIEFSRTNVDKAVATLVVNYVLRESSLAAPLTIVETWRLESQTAFDERAITKIDPTIQNIDDVKITNARYETAGLLADWSDSIGTPEKYSVGLDVFVENTRQWQPTASDVLVGGNNTSCSFNAQTGICNNTNPISTPPSQFYRVRVAPYSNGVTGKASNAFVAGPDYIP